MRSQLKILSENLELDGVTYDMKDKDGNELGRKPVIAPMYKKYYRSSPKMMMDIQVLLMVTW